MTIKRYFVSAVGWLCVEYTNGKRMPITQLTWEQVRDWNQAHS